MCIRLFVQHPLRNLPHAFKYDLWKPPLYLKSKPGTTNCYVPVVSMFTGRTPMPCIHASHILSSVCIHQNLLDKQPENLCNNPWLPFVQTLTQKPFGLTLEACVCFLLASEFLTCIESLAFIGVSNQ